MAAWTPSGWEWSATMRHHRPWCSLHSASSSLHRLPWLPVLLLRGCEPDSGCQRNPSCQARPQGSLSQHSRMMQRFPMQRAARPAPVVQLSYEACLQEEEEAEATHARDAGAASASGRGAASPPPPRPTPPISHPPPVHRGHASTPPAAALRPYMPQRPASQTIPVRPSSQPAQPQPPSRLPPAPPAPCGGGAAHNAQSLSAMFPHLFPQARPASPPAAPPPPPAQPMAPMPVQPRPAVPRPSSPTPPLNLPPAFAPPANVPGAYKPPAAKAVAQTAPRRQLCTKCGARRSDYLLLSCRHWGPCDQCMPTAADQHLYPACLVPGCGKPAGQFQRVFYS